VLQWLNDARSSALTYREVGATRDGSLPAGYRHDCRRVELGAGAEVFERTVSGLRNWSVHRDAGLDIVPALAKVEEGVDIAVVGRAAPLYFVALCRIVYVIDGPDRHGFAYGTLPGHPESGEEAFVVERQPSGETVFGIVAFSRPAELLARVANPITRSVQVAVTNRYLEAVRGIADF
jgi:uncharacterized protein (UPF0548 family)